MKRVVYQRAPVREFAPPGQRVTWSTARLARGGIRALRARWEDGGGNEGARGKSILQGARGPIGRDWPLQTRSLHASAPPLHSRLACSLPAHPRHCKVAAFRCAPLRSLFRGDGTGWSRRLSSHEGWRTAQRGRDRTGTGAQCAHGGAPWEWLEHADLAQWRPLPAATDFQPQ
jgi:hypothetical protein